MSDMPNPDAHGSREMPNMQPAPEPSPRAQPPVARPTNQAPWQVVLQIGRERTQLVHIELRDGMILGRADPATGFVPDLDLTRFGAEEAGVSRHHAVLYPALGGPHLSDLGSLNGTRLNGRMIDPGKLYRLREGDVIELCKLTIVLQTTYRSRTTQEPHRASALSATRPI